MGMKRGREDGSDGAEGEIEYEKLRNARLAENQKRMEELGLLNLSKCLRESVRSPASSRASSRSPSSIPRLSTPAGPARRSSRYVVERAFCPHLNVNVWCFFILVLPGHA